MKTNALTVSRLKKAYTTKQGGNHFQALNGIDFTVEKGEFVEIMGPSGAGKSTLLNIIATIDDTTSGSVSIEGQDPGKMSEAQLSDFRRKQLGFIFQDYNLLDTMTLQENIALHCRISFFWRFRVLRKLPLL